MGESSSTPAWNEQDSEAFMDYGRYMVPEREAQIDTIARLIPACDGPFNVLELACGEGLLAEVILMRFPACTVHGLDGSTEMLDVARTRLAHHGGRFVPRQFDLASDDWRAPAFPVHAVISSLSVHHLDGSEKQNLFRDVYKMLLPGGALVIADLVQPAGSTGLALAADGWDETVKERSLQMAGDDRAIEFFRDERWNIFRYPDPMDKPSGLFEQLKWLEEAGFVEVDAYWMRAGHAIYGGRKPGE